MRLTLPILLFAGALLVRILFNVYVIGLDTPAVDSFSDWKEYDAVGLSIANGSGFSLNNTPYTIHPPGYPLLLGAIYAICGHSYAAVKMVQSVLGALTCVLILMIGERLFERRVGVIAAAIAACYPFLVFYTGILMSETLFVFLSTSFMYALVRLREAHTGLWVVFAGMILGMMNLTRPVTLLLPAVLFFWAWTEFGTKTRGAAIAGVIAVVMAVTILPWTVRNYVVAGSVIPVVTTHWVTLYGANNRTIIQNPEAVGGWVDPEPMTEEGYRAAYFAFVRDYLFHEPIELVKLELHKLKRFWSIFPKTRTASRDGVISLFSYGLMLPFFLIGMVLSLRTPQKPWVLFAWILYFCLATLITHGATRYRLPVEPVIILFGAFALERLWRGSSNVPRVVNPCAA
jgi:4-amino-4-deoxy-L-arabinose transferase-like glycosyltransferase